MEISHVFAEFTLVELVFGLDKPQSIGIILWSVQLAKMSALILVFAD